MRRLAAGRVFTVALCGALAACSAPATTAPSVSGSGSTPAFVCAQPEHAALPSWARSGFEPPDQPVAHLLSVDGHIVAVPFGWPLREKQPEGRTNKVLWIADHNDGGPMTIDARRESDGALVHRELPDGPGPSIVDLAEGCWQLELAWPGGTDRIYLEYLGRAA